MVATVVIIALVIVTSASTIAALVITAAITATCRVTKSKVIAAQDTLTTAMIP